MAEVPIRFDDGIAYERMMGVWSRLVGDIFLDWLDPTNGQRWIDVGCGNGAFTELLMQRGAPREVQGIDPSAGQLAFARSRLDAKGAIFAHGDAMSLPFEFNRFDVAVMALVIHFVSDPARSIAEMSRVVRPGGTVTAYVWNLGDSPVAPVEAALRSMGITPLVRPGDDAQRMETLHGLWTNGGLEAVETHNITVTRSFGDFDDFWGATTGSGTLKPMLASMDASSVARLRERVRERLPADASGRITYGSRANAIRGLVPA